MALIRDGAFDTDASPVAHLHSAGLLNTFTFPMKKILFALLSAASFSVQACTIFHTADATSVSDKFMAAGAWSPDAGLTKEKYLAVCKKLEKANAKIQINATAVVLGEASIGWASLSVKDRKLAIATSSYSSLHTLVNSYASQDKADELMVIAINRALEGWSGIDQALQQLDKERAAIKANMRAK